MKRFVTKKTIKVPRYKLLYLTLFFSVFLLIVINIFFNLGMKHINGDGIWNLFISNTFGNLFTRYSFYQKKTDFFYKNVYGFSFENDTEVMEEKNNFSELIIESNPIVYIYNTFQTDKYERAYYNSYSISPVITQASFILQEYLKNKGIISVVETESVAKVLKENNISYSLSYRGSRILLEKAKENNPTLQFFFDLGMSDDSYDSTTIDIDDNSYARVLFIVGTDNANYAENQKLATSLHELLEKRYPNLSRGVSLRGGAGYHGVYNQDFSPNSLLIYVGGKENNISEVNLTLKILADVIAQYIGGAYEKE